MLKSSLAALLLCILPACGKSDPHALINEGSLALNSGKYADAAKSYEEALVVLGTDTTSPDWKQAKLGLIKAHIRTDAARAKGEFLQLASAAPSKVTDSDFNLIASLFGDASKFDEAIEILKVGKEMFPESPHLDALGKELVNKAKASGATDALGKLKGLGYVGGE